MIFDYDQSVNRNDVMRPGNKLLIFECINNFNTFSYVKNQLIANNNVALKSSLKITIQFKLLCDEKFLIIRLKVA